MADDTGTEATEAETGSEETEQAEQATSEDIAALRKALAKANDEAKTYRLKYRESDAERQKSLPEAERAIKEAEDRGRTAAVTEYGKRLARTEFDAAAARRNPDVDTAGVLEYVDLSRFVGDDGEPDIKAIKAAVSRLVPEAGGVTPGFDGGARKPPPAGDDMNARLRAAAGR